MIVAGRTFWLELVPVEKGCEGCAFDEDTGSGLTPEEKMDGCVSDALRCCRPNAVYKEATTTSVTEAMVDAADAAVPYLPAEIHRRRPAIRRMLEAALKEKK